MLDNKPELQSSKSRDRISSSFDTKRIIDPFGDRHVTVLRMSKHGIAGMREFTMEI